MHHPAGSWSPGFSLDFMSGSKNIDLLERGLLFVFIAAGQPEAAALVPAAK